MTFLRCIGRSYRWKKLFHDASRLPLICGGNLVQNLHGRSASNEEACSYEEVVEISDFLKSKSKHRPKVGIIFGSGISGFAECLDDRSEFPYREIPGFPVSSVSGHAGKLVLGDLKGVSTICMLGRFHSYEGIPMWKCVLPIRVMKLLGVETLIVTNASGGLNPRFEVGDLMLIKDHINFPAFAGNNPLRGLNDERWGPRFPGLNNPYDPKLRKLAKEIAAETGLGDVIQEGVYAMYGGPSYETVSEYRMIKLLGADAVGMSTALETVAAKHCGMTTFGISLISNKCILDYDAEIPSVSHAHVLDAAQMRNPDLVKLLVKLIERMDKP